MFDVKNFHKYLYGRPFTIYTNHKQLISLFKEKHPSPKWSLKWAVTLSVYEHIKMYKPGKCHTNAYGLSTLKYTNYTNTQQSKSC